MFATVLIPTDLTPVPRDVTDCASGLVALGMRSIVLLHALGLRHLRDTAPALEALVRPGLSKQAHALERCGVPVEVVVAPGLPHEETNRIARERRASVVLLGSQGASLSSELRPGAVTLETLHRCEVPALLARATLGAPGQCAIEGRSLARRILHPTDFSDGAERAFGYVRALVATGGVEAVSLVHVQAPRDRSGVHEHSQAPAPIDEFDRLRLARLERDLREAGAAYVHSEVLHGTPVESILHRAAEAPRTLIVMGSQGRGLVPEILLGSVSRAVARHATAPVLLVPCRSRAGEPS